MRITSGPALLALCAALAAGARPEAPPAGGRPAGAAAGPPTLALLPPASPRAASPSPAAAARGVERVSLEEALRLGAVEDGRFRVWTDEEAVRAAGGFLPRNCFSESCALRAGRRLGASLLLLSEYSRRDSLSILKLVLLEPATGRVRGALLSSRALPSGDLLPFARDAALQLLAGGGAARAGSDSAGKWRDIPWLNPKDSMDNRRNWKWAGSGVLLAALGLAWVQGQLWQEDGNGATAQERLLSGAGASSFLRGFYAAPTLGAQYAAMGGAGIAHVDNGLSLLMNPAGVAGMDRENGLAAKRSLPGGVPSFFMAYAGPLRGKWYQGLGVHYEGDGLARETTLQGALARDWSSFGPAWTGVKTGANLKLYLAQVGETGTGSERATGHSFGAGLDLGLQARLTDKIKGALVVRDAVSFLRHANTYTNRSYAEVLPPEYRVGAAYQALPTLSMAIDGQKGMYADQVDHLRLGAEKRALGFLFLRAGLHQIFAREAVRKMALGFGLDTDGFESGLPAGRVVVNYSYEFGLSEDEPLGGGQQFSLEVCF